jgi:hypothetical protein
MTTTNIKTIANLKRFLRVDPSQFFVIKKMAIPRNRTTKSKGVNPGAVRESVRPILKPSCQ